MLVGACDLLPMICVISIVVMFGLVLQVVFHFQTINEPAVIKRLLSILHKNTGEMIQKRPR